MLPIEELPGKATAQHEPDLAGACLKMVWENKDLQQEGQQGAQG